MLQYSIMLDQTKAVNSQHITVYGHPTLHRLICRILLQLVQGSSAIHRAEKARPGEYTQSLVYRARLSQFSDDSKQPMPPHHPLVRHLLLVKGHLSRLPHDAHPSYLPWIIRRATPDIGPVFYLDLWPFTIPLLAVTSPSIASQFTQEVSLPKSPALVKWIRPLAENKDLVSMEGQLWKQWRGVYNPGFSASHLMFLVPQIVEEVEHFCDILRDRARAGFIFQLEEATVNLTMDVIGRVAM